MESSPTKERTHFPSTGRFFFNRRGPKYTSGTLVSTRSSSVNLSRTSNRKAATQIPGDPSPMNKKYVTTLLIATAATWLGAAAHLSAQQVAAPNAPKPEDTEIWEPVPPVVTPGATCGAPPSHT